MYTFNQRLSKYFAYVRKWYPTDEGKLLVLQRIVWLAGDMICSGLYKRLRKRRPALMTHHECAKKVCFLNNFLSFGVCNKPVDLSCKLLCVRTACTGQNLTEEKLMK